MNSKQRRLEFQKILETILGSEQVWFQSPGAEKMKYPAIVYSRTRIDDTFANDEKYSSRKAYTVIIIDPDPDSEIPDKVGKLPFSKFNRHYKANNLNHDVFTVYY